MKSVIVSNNEQVRVGDSVLISSLYYSFTSSHHDRMSLRQHCRDKTVFVVTEITRAGFLRVNHVDGTPYRDKNRTPPVPYSLHPKWVIKEDPKDKIIKNFKPWSE